MKSTILKFNGVLKASHKEVITDVQRLYSGHGAGSGGRGAGSIHGAGGTFKKLGTAKEAQYFYKKERELIENLRSEMKDQIRYHEKQIAINQDAIEKIKRKQKDI